VQVLHLGQLHSLVTCNLANNFLNDLRTSGLCACDALTDLNVSGNVLADLASVEYLALVPSLLNLQLKGNPIAGDKHSRWAWLAYRMPHP
jgi:hypothetical protein